MFTIRDYDSAKYKFAEMLKGLFGVEDLNQVHILDPALCEESAAVSFNNEVKTFFHEKFYEKLRSPWNEYIKRHLLLEYMFQITKLFHFGILTAMRSTCTRLERLILLSP